MNKKSLSTDLFNGFVKGFIYGGIACLALTGLYFSGYYIGKVIGGIIF